MYSIREKYIKSEYAIQIGRVNALQECIAGMLKCRSLQQVHGASANGEEQYATVCVTFKPEEVPEGFLRKVLSVAASKVGSGEAALASHVMVVVNVGFRSRAGRLSSDVLLLKSPIVLASCWGGGVSDDR
ncbi:MAG: hypothetical protein RMK50_04635 [Nitrososphaerota archaeon]|nr:hypothetical protein [Candidatus Bathyarchaeota archaeon]MDW8194086.1 hypothetical protein [Nitrososphaerota archaeon]